MYIALQFFSFADISKNNDSSLPFLEHDRCFNTLLIPFARSWDQVQELWCGVKDQGSSHVLPHYLWCWYPCICPHPIFLILSKCLHSLKKQKREEESIWSQFYKLTDLLLVTKNTHILHSISIFLLVEVVIKCSHVRLFEIGLERKTSTEKSDRVKNEHFMFKFSI